MNASSARSVFGRMIQLKGRGPLAIPIYESRDGNTPDRTELHVSSLRKTTSGNYIATGFVVDPDSAPDDPRYKFRTVRIDRIKRSRPNRHSKFFCLKKNFKKANT